MLQTLDVLTAALRADPLAAGAAGFFVGAWVGMRLQLALERRKEFNAAALPLREALLPFIEHPTPYVRLLDTQQLDTALHAAGWWHRRRLRQCIDALRQAREQDTDGDAWGQRSYRTPQQVAKAAAALHRCLRPR